MECFLSHCGRKKATGTIKKKRRLEFHQSTTCGFSLVYFRDVKGNDLQMQLLHNQGVTSAVLA